MSPTTKLEPSLKAKADKERQAKDFNLGDPVEHKETKATKPNENKTADIKHPDERRIDFAHASENTVHVGGCGINVTAHKTVILPNGIKVENN